jgi:hypothetical protein
MLVGAEELEEGFFRGMRHEIVLARWRDRQDVMYLR